MPVKSCEQLLKFAMRRIKLAGTLSLYLNLTIFQFILILSESLNINIIDRRTTKPRNEQQPELIPASCIY